MHEPLERRVARIRQRCVVRSWEYRQRNLAHGCWGKLRMLFALSAQAYEPDDGAVDSLRARGGLPNPVGTLFHPEKQIFLLSLEDVANLPGLRRIPMETTSFGLERIGLLPFVEVQKRLYELARRETELRTSISDPTELPSVEEEYCHVHAAYVWFATAACDLEALKRSFFLEWYSMTEPPDLCGLGRIQKNPLVLAAVEQRLASGNLDQEFLGMLQHYLTVLDFGLTSLIPTLQSQQAWDPAFAVERSPWGDRGQMGWYWDSLLGKRLRSAQ